MIFKKAAHEEHFSSFLSINEAFESKEEDLIKAMIDSLSFLDSHHAVIQNRAKNWAQTLRAKPLDPFSLESFLSLYPMNSPQGHALMSLSEAYLRIPDNVTKNDLITDKLQAAQWEKPLGSGILGGFVSNTLSLAQKILGPTNNYNVDILRKIARKTCSPFIRKSIEEMIQNIANQFILGDSIEKAYKKSDTLDSLMSFDMLGEGARTSEDAARYFDAYEQALDYLGRQSKRAADGYHQNFPSISIKLSALHPRYEPLKKERVLDELTTKVLHLAIKAYSLNIGLTIDAEEIDRLYPSLMIFKKVFENPQLKKWNGLGLAVQAYHKGALPLIKLLKKLSQKYDKKIPIRLVKGAYWDAEIKIAQQRGLKAFPVYTRKMLSDVSYLACANKLIKNIANFYPQFATHNIQTISSVLEIIKHYHEISPLNPNQYEFQHLFGMGKGQFEELKKFYPNTSIRMYAPVGNYKDLLSYLVRRLLENGANSSFINQLYDKNINLDKLIQDPIKKLNNSPISNHPLIPLPSHIFDETHLNSAGLDIRNILNVESLYAQLEVYKKKYWNVVPLIHPKVHSKSLPQKAKNPSNFSDIIGEFTLADETVVRNSLENALKAFPLWSQTTVETRAASLEKLALHLEEEMPRLISILIREGGKILDDAVDEIREAIDFCRYYAAQARKIMSAPISLQGPAGEINELSYNPRGVFICISPWNFPLAIFIGQIAAALAAGNCVIAKPASQTPIIAFEAVKLAYSAGIPKDVLQFVPAPVPLITQHLLSDSRIEGVVFTGSNKSANQINYHLARKSGPIVPFIAETGGINAMIVDSSALIEQVVDDVLQSGFKSAGQRCSSLRILFIQKEIFTSLTHSIKGAMQELKVGDPWDPSVDVGPIISEQARKRLEHHINDLRKMNATLLGQANGPLNQDGFFFEPQLWQLKNHADLKVESFGPIVHVVPFDINHFEEVIKRINSYGFGLTLGFHSRIDSRIEYVRHNARVGNFYVNRNMIGAIVGSQPFGGEGLSGTGPKAGGPNYLYKFLTERVYTKNTTASGGNLSLLCLDD